MLLLLDRAFELLMKPAILHRAGRMMGTRNRGPAIGPQRSIRSATESQMSVPSAATFTFTAALIWSTSAVAQVSNGNSADRPLTIEVASASMRRYPVLATAAGQAANRAADAALDHLFGRPNGKTAGAVAKRVLRLWVVGMPIASASSFVAHETGHVSRAEQVDAAVRGLKVRRWPWPLPHLAGTLRIDDPVDELAIAAGGGEGSLIQEEALVDRIYERAEADYFDWLLLTYAKLDLPIYTWASRLSDRLALPFDGLPGDPRRYANEFATRRAFVRFQAPPGLSFVPTELEYPRVATTIQHGMWLNLADYTLAAAVMRNIQYIASGERVTPNPALKIGRFQFLPGARFGLTSVGLETAITTRVLSSRRLTRAEVRSIETPSGRHLWAAAIDGTPRLTVGLAPTFRADIFQRARDRFGIADEGLGVRIEAGFEKPISRVGHLADIGIRLGYKSKGYLADAPYKATMLGAVRVSVRF
jgi:hypothetical protein